jgi:DNA modification methylase
MDKYIDDNSKDFIFSCPPYADLEVYSNLPNDISNMSHKDFFKTYSKILKNTFSKLKEDRFAVIVTSEVRGMDGGYINLVGKTIDIMVNAGYLFYNDIILVNSVGTLPLRAGRYMNTSRKIGRRHQNVLVFYKGDPKKIKENFSELIPKNKYYESGDI